MDTKDKVLQYIKKRRSSRGREICKLFKISRQALNKHLKELLKEGKITKGGATKGARYYYGAYKKTTILTYRKECSLQNLKEDLIFKEAARLLNLKKKVKENVFDIIYYAFTEILNNAIEHSHSKKCLIELLLSPYQCDFRIRDYGIGIFNSISTKLRLHSENEAVEELLKGKKTTMPNRHTGEGIFFTSKSADIMNFRSHRINLIFDNSKKDLFVEEKKFIKGTDVSFNISKYSKRKLGQIFDFYAPEEFEYRFERTKVLVKLFREKYMSRSEARRLLFGLNKFKEIVLDFKGMKSMGQGFADEIFRVFQKDHPNISIKIENISPSLKPIIKHVVDK